MYAISFLFRSDLSIILFPIHAVAPEANAKPPAAAANGLDVNNASAAGPATKDNTDVTPARTVRIPCFLKAYS